MNPALVAALAADPHAPPIDDVAAWWALWRAPAVAAHASPAARAVAGGFAADRVGWAFAGGYQAALRALVPGLRDDVLAAFCVTEAGGNRPRDIRTTIAPQADGTLRIDGGKRWTTLGPAGTLLLVVGALSSQASDTPPARPALRVARVPVPTPGLALEPMPPTRFVPEVPHAEVRLHDVRVRADALLPGDGYDAFVKPFRTIEDIHVTLAVLAYLLREARLRDWPAGYREQVVSTLALLSALAAEDAQAPATHVALAGALHGAHALYAQASALWAAAGDDAAAGRWARDAALFEVAGAARAQRARRAWERLGAPAAD